MPNKNSRILVFRSGFCQLPVIDKDSSPPRAHRDEIIKTEVERFQELSHSETFSGANIIYVTVEKSLKLRIFMEGDPHPIENENRKFQDGFECFPKSLVMQEGVSHLEDSELFFMKETRGDAFHYPLRVTVRSRDDGDTGLSWNGRVEKKTIDEVSKVIS